MKCHWDKILGRFELAKIQSQENCLFESHRFYPRAMGRGLGMPKGGLGYLRNLGVRYTHY